MKPVAIRKIKVTSIDDSGLEQELMTTILKIYEIKQNELYEIHEECPDIETHSQIIFSVENGKMIDFRKNEDMPLTPEHVTFLEDNGFTCDYISNGNEMIPLPKRIICSHCLGEGKILNFEDLVSCNLCGGLGVISIEEFAEEHNVTSKEAYFHLMKIKSENELN